jgi:hypothetical protein
MAGAAGSMPKSARQLAAILQVFYVVPAVASDGLGPGAPTGLSMFMLALSGLIWVLTNGFPSIVLLVSGITAPILVVSAGATIWGSIPKFINAIKSLGANAINDALIVLFALYGLGRYVLVALSQVTDVAQLAANLLLPLPYIMGMLNLTVFRDDILAPVFLGTVFAFDIVGFAGGGTIEFIDASTFALHEATA